jgi:soluble lytic murein transglycosylase-like protein
MAWIVETKVMHFEGFGLNRGIYGRPGRQENLLGDRFNQGGSYPWQKRFVLAHAGAAASGQHEPRSAALHEAPAAGHETMVATGGSPLTHESTNKKMYICFITAFAMTLAASPLRAADALGTDSPAPKALVVRADRRTGKLVRSVAPVKASSETKALPSMNISEIVEKAAHDNHVDPLLVHSIIQVESNYNPYALSPKGAQGLMQLMPPTARDLGVSNSFDPRQNIEAGVRYLKYLQDLYKDDRLALAAYNAGPGAVEKYKWIPPYPETQDYVNRVGQQYGAAKKAAAQHLAAPVAPPVGVMEEKHPKLEPFIDAEGRLHLRTTQQ